VIAYLDSSVILRILLGQPGRLADWKKVSHGVTSELAEVECLRTIDRYQQRGLVSPDDAAPRREAVYRLMEEMEVIGVTSAVLRRASQPMPIPLGTLDAIHLATAQLVQETRQSELVLATHDNALALAARATGFPIIGV
jgi:predicted nucleic acid-binding protein